MVPAFSACAGADPSANQRARGWRRQGGPEEEKEGLDLVKDERLGPEALAKSRANALKLEEHAYKIKEFYSKMQTAKPTL